MGTAMFDLNVPVTKTSTALLALTKDDVSALEPGPCINCGRCVEACPGRIIPSRLADYAERFDEQAFLDAYGMECCECGCCSFVCPAKRQLCLPCQKAPDPGDQVHAQDTAGKKEEGIRLSCETGDAEV